MEMNAFLQAAPKAELNLRLEGAMNPATLQVIANQNDIPMTVKHFDELMKQIAAPEYKRADDLARIASTWISTPLELARIAYDAATALHKVNVRYVEIAVNPMLYDSMALRYEDLFTALNDGRDRAQRAWGIRINWVIAIPRDEPRRADDATRFASSAAGRRAAVVGVALVGREDVQPVGQFERAFKSAEKHETPRVVQAGAVEGAEGVQRALDALNPSRLIDAWGAWSDPALVTRLAETKVGLVAGITRGLKGGQIAAATDVPLRQMIDDNVLITLSVDAPVQLGVTLTDAYTQTVRECGLDMDDARALLLNGVRMSFLPEEERQQLEAQFLAEMEQVTAAP
jgi:aminodeoxyfutalosine deaminase